MNNMTIGQYTRITKQAARARFHDGQATYALPCKMSPVNMWQAPAAVPVYDVKNCTSFDGWVNEYEYFNCNNETGTYIAYWIIKEAAQ